MDAFVKYQERTYKYKEVCFFRKTKELYGGLSNMASGFPLKVNNVNILTSEALYQACRYPHFPEIQKKIIKEKSPMSAKMVGKPYRDHTRPDWDKVRVDLMYWCLQVKLAQNFIAFGQLLESTCDKPIVEESNKDPFWGAIKSKDDENCLVGVNALGRLLMKLRQEYNSTKRYDLLFVEPLNISDFLIYGEPIQIIDLRQTFIDNLQNYWGLKTKTQINKLNVTPKETDLNGSTIEDPQSVVSEPDSKLKKPRKNTTKKLTKKETAIQQKLL